MDPGKGGSPLEEDVPGPEVEEFANALDTCLSPGLSVAEKKARILDLPRKYHENAIRRLAQKLPKPTRRETEDMDVDADADADDKDVIENTPEIIQLEKEVETWDLLRRLLPLRNADANSESMRLSPFSSSRSAQPDVVDDFILTSSVAQERQAVLQWLQTNAASGPDIDDMCRELQQNADRGDIIAHGWLHTRSKIKLRKSVTAWPHLLDKQSTSIAASHVNSDGAPLVTQLDPDAVTRQGRKLEPQDEYFERSIWLGCFEHLRRGSSLDDIRDWCQERTEMWRAVSMSAMPLSLSGLNEPSSNADPASLALWRRMCYALARQGGCDDYERAVYGLLSGDIASVRKVAKSWDDHLFAHYNALLRSQIDAYMLSQCPPAVASTLSQSLPSVDAVQFQKDHVTADRHLVESLEQQKTTQAEALEPHKALQASLIADKINLHLYEQGIVIAEDANRQRPSRLMPVRLRDHSAIVSKKYFNQSDRRGLRIAAHTFVLIALLQRFDAQEGGSISEDIQLAEWRVDQENILAGYTEYLRLARLQELIPLYCSVLTEPRRYEVLSWNEVEEVDAPGRLTQLKLIKRAGIDVVTFVETQATMFLREMHANANMLPIKDDRERFTILAPGPPSARHGRAIRPDFFTDDGSDVEPTDEKVIRSLEWLLTVSETWPKVFSVGTQAYKFFLST